MVGKHYYKYGNERIVDALLVAQNTFCAAFGVEQNQPFSVISTGTWTGTLTLQKSLDYWRLANHPGCDGNDLPIDGLTYADTNATWLDISTSTTNLLTTQTEVENYIFYRLGFKTGGYSSGGALVRLAY